MEARKIAIACFVGGVLCATVAFYVARPLWWLGFPAGFFGGYLTCEFRQTLGAIPRAFSAVVSGIAGTITTWYWFGYYRRHFVAVWVLFWASAMIYLKYSGLSRVWLPVGIEVSGLASFVAMWIFSFIASVGARAKGIVFIGSSWYPNRESDWILEDDHRLVEIDPTFLALGRWFLSGLWRVLVVLTVVAVAFGLVWGAFTLAKMTLTFVGHLPAGVWMVIWGMIAFAVLVMAHVMILTHSWKRVLCGLDGAIGGALSYWLFVMNHWFFTGELSFGERALVVITGGMLGAMLGLANWELLSKRLLKVAVKS
ncbi:MAG: hypothetical protein JWO84_702 [Parcubacteria group bacterium]|nr:hypothetical protein [Parcubacteria group bacterium]